MTVMTQDVLLLTMEKFPLQEKVLSKMIKLSESKLKEKMQMKTILQLNILLEPAL